MTTDVAAAQPVNTFWRDYAFEMAGSIAAGSVGAMIGDLAPIEGALFGVVHKLVFDPIYSCLGTLLRDSSGAKVVRLAIAHFFAIAAAFVVTYGIFQFKVQMGALMLPIALVIQSYVRTYHPLLVCPCLVCACCLV